MVPEAGFEPARPCDRGILSPLRIPVPPLRRRAAEHTTPPQIGTPRFSTIEYPGLGVQL